MYNPRRWLDLLRRPILSSSVFVPLFAACPLPPSCGSHTVNHRYPSRVPPPLFSPRRRPSSKKHDSTETISTRIRTGIYKKKARNADRHPQVFFLNRKTACGKKKKKKKKGKPTPGMENESRKKTPGGTEPPSSCLQEIIGKRTEKGR
ncbi:hypothetical protein LY78DRAFT_378222 [Colletotrichum sublineola]|nr:hypothetical protein LY78DRAFT_378222 [Colletotrichum sublineola]